MESVVTGGSATPVLPPAMLGTIESVSVPATGSRVFFQIADVFVVQVNIDEAAQFPLVVKNLPAEFGILRGERRQHLAYRRALKFHRIVFVNELAQGRGNQDFGHINSSFSATVWSAFGRKLFAWSNFPPLIDSTTNEYQGHEFSRSVLEKYASQSGCEWKMPIRSRPCCPRVLVGGQQILGANLVAIFLLAFIRVFQADRGGYQFGARHRSCRS